MRRSPPMTLSAAIRKQASRVVALAMIAVTYGLARQPGLAEADRQGLADRFHFTGQTLPELSSLPRRSVRPVHPSLERISPWISSVGAAVALNDLDGDGLPN